MRGHSSLLIAVTGVVLGASAACTETSNVGNQRTDAGASDSGNAGAGDGGGARDAGTPPADTGGGGLPADAGAPALIWGVRVRLVADPPVSPATLSGLVVTAGDNDRQPDPLHAELTWPTTVEPRPAPGTRLDALHGCGQPGGLCSLRFGTDGLCSGASYPSGCLWMAFDITETISGTFVHPTGTRCALHGGQADITLRDITGVPTTAYSERTDVAAGTFETLCRSPEGVAIRLQGRFQLGVTRAFLIE